MTNLTQGGGKSLAENPGRYRRCRENLRVASRPAARYTVEEHIIDEEEPVNDHE
ncbi:MAG: hypothetical protein LC804_05510 [Acidobacteria bacterium]|nr:hypothetical protein [Acidobacteriota bacterium]